MAISRLHTEGPQVTGVNVPNVVARATKRSGFCNSCMKIALLKLMFF